MAEATRVRSRESAQSSTSADPMKKGEYGYPSGHLGHLTDVQETAFAEFKALLRERDLITSGEDGKPPSHDDVVLLRFLRARRFLPRDALQQFAATEKWRAANEIDNLYLNIDVNDYAETWNLYPQWIGRRDKRGLPVYVFEVAPLNSKTMAAYAKSANSTAVLGAKRAHTGKDAVPPKLYRLFALYENLTNFAMPLCTDMRDRPVPRTPISQANNIVDISGVGIKQFWNLRGHMQDASVLATAHYPETLDRIFIVGAPSFFPTVWEWIKRWFDPITVSKIFILSEATTFKTLSSFIDPENIPTKYGGTLPFKFGAGPVLDPHIASALSFKDPEAPWPRGPIKFETDPDSADTETPIRKLIAVGSVDGKERREHIATFTPDPVPPPTEPETSAAPDSAIDFATNTVVVSRGSGTAAPGPPSPTALKERAGNAEPVASESKAGDEVVETAPVPPAPEAVPKVGEVPLAATATPLPSANGESKPGVGTAAEGKKPESASVGA